MTSRHGLLSPTDHYEPCTSLCTTMDPLMLLRASATRLANERDDRHRRVAQELPATVIIAARLKITVAAADVCPLRSIRRPDRTPAAVIVAVIGKGEGGAEECKAAEAVVEEEAVVGE